MSCLWILLAQEDSRLDEDWKQVRRLGLDKQDVAKISDDLASSGGKAHDHIEFGTKRKQRYFIIFLFWNFGILGIVQSKKSVVKSSS